MRNEDKRYGGEFYVESCRIVDVLPWVESLIGPVNCVYTSEHPTGRVQMFDGERDGQHIRVVIGEQDPHGPWTNVLFGGPGSIHLPWTTEVEMARQAFAHLKRRIRCDPGLLAQHGPLSDEFWEIDAFGERVIVLND